MPPSCLCLVVALLGFHSFTDGLRLEPHSQPNGTKFVKPAFRRHSASGPPPARRTTGHDSIDKFSAVHGLHTKVTVGAEWNSSKAHGNASKVLSNGSFACVASNTVFDLGFYDGADSGAYLVHGMCVVGIEADPDLYATGAAKFQSYIATGQLTLANAAVAPSGNTDHWTTFYRNFCNKEWNSFYDTVGCRSCDPPHLVDPVNCEAVQVQAVTCKDILLTYGVPKYLKLDIEGAEPGCFSAIEVLGAGWLPQYISAEVTEMAYIDSLHNLGYTGFKLVRQDSLHDGSSSQSGPWGDWAWDCRVGLAWRSYAEIRHEMSQVLIRPYDPAESCSGGIFPIHEQGPNSQSNYIWYDLHAHVMPPANR